MTNEAVILVAGEGKRLRPFTYQQPKCFAVVNGRRILENTLSALAAQGCRRAVIVTGHLAGVVQEVITGKYAGMEIRYVHNPEYATTNSMFSLLLGLEQAQGPAWVIEGDVFLDHEVFSKLLQADITWVVDSSARHLDGSFVRFDTGHQAISQRIVRDLSQLTDGEGKSVGLLYLRARGVVMLREWLRAAVEAGRKNDYYDLIVGSHMTGSGIAVSDIAGSRWFEIDSSDDLAAANRLFV